MVKLTTNCANWSESSSKIVINFRSSFNSRFIKDGKSLKEETKSEKSDFSSSVERNSYSKLVQAKMESKKKLQSTASCNSSH